jgi:hypothetical protein
MKNLITRSLRNWSKLQIRDISTRNTQDLPTRTNILFFHSYPKLRLIIILTCMLFLSACSSSLSQSLLSNNPMLSITALVPKN